jgi:hypothetical protein
MQPGLGELQFDWIQLDSFDYNRTLETQCLRVETKCEKAKASKEETEKKKQKAENQPGPVELKFN